jgi:pilus assembly protein CpaE
MVQAKSNVRAGRGGALRVMVVGDAPEHRAAVRSALESLTELPLEVAESEPQPGTASEDGGPPADVIMVVFDRHEDALFGYLQAQAALVPRPILFALLTNRSAGLMKRVLRAGADELLFLPLDAGDVTRALLKISEARWRADRHDGGLVCSFASVVGGVGVTSIVANLGLALRYEMKKRVALVDLDLQSGGLSAFLGLEPEVSILPLTRLERKLDSIQLESALTKHSSGVYVLAAPKRIEEGELVSDVTVATVLDLMRQLFDFVIVDCSTHVDENAVAAWERSDHLFYVLTQSVTGVRCAWRFIDLFERLGLATLEPRFLLNRFQPSHALTEKHIEGTLGRPIYAKVPADAKTMERVELAAQDIFQVAPHSPIARAVVELTRLVNPGADAEAEQESGLVSRLLSALSARS